MSNSIHVQQLSEFDMAEHLRNDEDIAEYLSLVLQDGDTDELIRALGHIAKARGMMQLAKESGLGQEGLYNTLRVGSHPPFDSIMKVLKALHFDLKAVCHSTEH